MPARSALVTLTTDFGQLDHYVGQMKGAILRVAPEATIVDITHAIAPQDVRAASFIVADLADAFPEGTVHLAVVDPGVGSARRVIAAEAGGRFYVGPDNGLFTLVLERFPDARIVEVPRDLDSTVSATFHGRDIMAPVAGRLARDGRIKEISGSPVRDPVRLAGLHPRITGDGLRIEGMAAWIDHFGNVITNIPAAMLEGIAGETVELSYGAHSIRGLRRYYSEVPQGEMILLAGSSGRLEVAVNGGSAAARWGVGTGDVVELRSVKNEE